MGAPDRRVGSSNRRRRTGAAAGNRGVRPADRTGAAAGLRGVRAAGAASVGTADGTLGVRTAVAIGGVRTTRHRGTDSGPAHAKTGTSLGADGSARRRAGPRGRKPTQARAAHAEDRPHLGADASRDGRIGRTGGRAGARAPGRADEDSGSYLAAAGRRLDRADSERHLAAGASDRTRDACVAAFGVRRHSESAT